MQSFVGHVAITGGDGPEGGKGFGGDWGKTDCLRLVENEGGVKG